MSKIIFKKLKPKHDAAAALIPQLRCFSLLPEMTYLSSGRKTATSSL